MLNDIFCEKQLEFICNSTATWNIAHGSVRSGKTVCTAFRFLQAANECPDSKIYIVGHTFDTAYRNVIKLMLYSDELSMFRPFLTWSGKKLHFKDKEIVVLGAKDEGSVGAFQGDTYSLVYCDEMTLYPKSIIEMIDTRLSKPWSMGFTAMNPTYPDHPLKQWIDKGEKGDERYYSLHFVLDDNTFLTEDYKERVRQSSSGIFYKRNILGLWCLAEGAIFEFFDRKIHVVSRAPRAADYYIAGVDYGASNPCACVVLGVSTGKYTQSGKCVWVEAEYFWNHKTRQKVNAEMANDICEFLEPYGPTHVYCDPSAAAFKQELRLRHLPVINADNDVEQGIQYMTSQMQQGNLFMFDGCKNLIREVEGYVWDRKSGERGHDEPVKINDHAIDALRYALYTHKIPKYEPYKQESSNETYLQNRFSSMRKRYF